MDNLELKLARKFAIEKYRHGVKGYMEYYILLKLGFNPKIVSTSTDVINNVRIRVTDVPKDMNSLENVQEAGEHLSKVYLKLNKKYLHELLSKYPKKTGFTDFENYIKKNNISFNGKGSKILNRFFFNSQKNFIIHEILLQDLKQSYSKSRPSEATRFASALGSEGLEANFRGIRLMIKYMEQRLLIIVFKVPPSMIETLSIDEQQIPEAEGGYRAIYSELKASFPGKHLVLMIEEDIESVSKDMQDLMLEMVDEALPAYLTLFEGLLIPEFIKLNPEMNMNNYLDYWTKFKKYSSDLFENELETIQLFLSQLNSSKKYQNDNIALEVFNQFTQNGDYTFSLYATEVRISLQGNLN